MQVHLSWKHPSTPKPFPDPSTYYVLLEDATLGIIYFRVEDSVSSFAHDQKFSFGDLIAMCIQSLQLNVNLAPLDATKSYKIAVRSVIMIIMLLTLIHLSIPTQIQPYVRCAGLEPYKNGCGPLSQAMDVSYAPPSGIIHSANKSKDAVEELLPSLNN